MKGRWLAPSMAAAEQKAFHGGGGRDGEKIFCGSK
ncbi:hypothetical protein ISN45_At03g012700 [Arabidopsis thaliana x Arabidopsis arenosa]|nr:hypothetical protein ISN45_At03g012700 [Arabidopsis thaliana x Arabidopsis arenosa]KAG7631009.1 hypothetical protein ISN44_As03g012750 [Arabidopsis suecica]CAA0382210.1 unnamed protein product [Arabidopsis thaliana]